jgi:plasmid maintenance system antidote protein VapI
MIINGKIVFGLWLKDTLMEHGFSSSVCARIIGVSQKSMESIINGTGYGHLSEENLIKLALLLEMDFEEINNLYTIAKNHVNRQVPSKVAALYK